MAESEHTEPNSEKPWTVMVYMAASRDEQTEAAAIRDLKELEKVGTTDKCNVIVQIDRRWPGYFERYRVWKGTSESLDSSLAGQLREFLAKGNPQGLTEFYDNSIQRLQGASGVKNEEALRDRFSRRDPEVLRKLFSTGNPILLRDFVCWARKKFRAQNYLLVLWGHAFGLGFGRDHGDALAMLELAHALRSEGLELPPRKKTVDIIGANACAMSYAEAAFEVKDGASFMVAPETAMPFAGWPYEAILNEINNGSCAEPRDLGEKIVDLFVDSYSYAFEPRSVALTLLDLTKASELQPLLGKVTEALNSVIQKNGTREKIANAFLDTEHGDERPLIDLVDLCEELETIDGENGPIATAAAELRKFLETPGGFIVKPAPREVKSAPRKVKPAPREIEGLNGLGIYAPSVAGNVDLKRLELSKEDYVRLKLPEVTQWGNLIYGDLEAALRPMNEGVADFVNETGALTSEDRMGVAQLLMSVQRSFVRLRSTLRDSEKTLTGLITANSEKPAPESRAPIESAEIFGPPYLRLLNGNGAAPQEPSNPLASLAQDQREVANDRLVEAVVPLWRIEEELGRVEKTARKVLTHSRLGLGGGKADLGKADLGKADLGKADLGKADLGKADLGKADLGKADLGFLSIFGFDNGASLETTVAGLFREVAVSLKILEQAVGKLEGVAQSVLTSAATANNGSRPPDYQERLSEQLNSAFGEVAELANSAKQTLGAVLRHPSHGLGPQSALSFAERQQLAVFGGLSSRNLQLLR